ncbi:MAG: hypothetical protein NTX11_00035 [Candidatus Saccharibacteria bacterium]|nr:hypothetical protein [Candidatus Saccharibacteria bacterium]
MSIDTRFNYWDMECATGIGTAMSAQTWESWRGEEDFPIPNEGETPIGSITIDQAQTVGNIAFTSQAETEKMQVVISKTEFQQRLVECGVGSSVWAGIICRKLFTLQRSKHLDRVKGSTEFEHVPELFLDLPATFLDEECLPSKVYKAVDNLSLTALEELIAQANYGFEQEGKRGLAKVMSHGIGVGVLNALNVFMQNWHTHIKDQQQSHVYRSREW